jgi:hypothetical protein
VAERTVLVCDVCGAVGAETISLKTRSRAAQKDLCPKHLTEIFAGSRRPKRGRRPGAGASPAKQAAPQTKRGKRKSAIKRRTSKRAATAKPGPT